MCVVLGNNNNNTNNAGNFLFVYFVLRERCFLFYCFISADYVLYGLFELYTMSEQLSGRQ